MKTDLGLCSKASIGPNEFQAGRRLCLIFEPPDGGVYDEPRRIIMKNLMSNVKSFLHDEEGVTAIEYGLIASLVAVAIIVGASFLGTSLNTLFNDLGTCIANPSAANC